MFLIHSHISFKLGTTEKGMPRYFTIWFGPSHLRGNLQCHLGGPSSHPRKQDLCNAILLPEVWQNISRFYSKSAWVFFLSSIFIHSHKYTSDITLTIWCIWLIFTHHPQHFTSHSSPFYIFIFFEVTYPFRIKETRPY